MYFFTFWYLITTLVFNYNSEKVQLATSVLQMAIVGELEEVHTQYSYNITLECNLKNAMDSTTSNS